jgi:methylated-DNA-protein-cysteine methyltransferase-like protein
VAERGPGELPDGADLVLAVVESIPPGRVMSYGAVAEVVRERDGGRASARSVGSVMARWGGAVPWHRVVNSAGRLPPGHEHHARQRLEAEGVPFRHNHVDMRKAAWNPSE